MRTFSTRSTQQPSPNLRSGQHRPHSHRSHLVVRSQLPAPVSTDHAFLQRQCACGGGCPRCQEHLSQPTRLQAKLKIGKPNDPYEQEADRIADRVMRIPAPGLQWQLDIEEDQEDEAAAATAIQPKLNSGIQRFAEQATLLSETAPAETALTHVDRVLAGTGESLEPRLQQDMAQRFGYDFSQVRVHTDTAAEQSAKELNALAYTVGHNIVFGPGQFAPETHEGRQLIAHELVHTIQQNNDRNACSGAIQRRRVPAGPGLGATIPAGGVGFTAHRTGLVRALRRAWAELNPAQKATVRTRAATFGITGATDTALFGALATATQAQLLRFSTEIRTVRPDLTLGDPALIDTGPRPATADTANINTLVTRANSIFNTIASGARDADLTAVFGAANVAAAKTRYANARTRMNALHGTNRIVTDRSGYSAEVRLGGLTNPSQIALAPSVIDHPTNHASIITLLHESMHAGNNDVRDFGYINQPSFTTLSAAVKLTNAAHYQVVPNRILRPTHHDAFAGQTFVPAGTTVGSVTAPTLTPTEQAIRNTSEAFRRAWTVGLNLHKLFVRVFRTPSAWATLNLAAAYRGAQAGSRFSTTLPFWSKVEKLTIHERMASINPAAGSAAAAPVTLIDISLSEGLTRKLSQGMRGVPQTPAAALAFERAHLSAPAVTAARASTASETRVLKRLILRHVTRSMTGTVGRDFRVLERMVRTSRAANFTEYLKIRGPGAFPY